jgi:hypothetical protein
VAEQLLHGPQVAGLALRADAGGVTHVVNGGETSALDQARLLCDENPSTVNG